MVVAQEAPRRTHRRRDPQARRQRGRCRGCGRLCAGRHLSARRQYRRRRLHGDPSRQRANATSPSTIAKPRLPRRRQPCSSTPRAIPIRQNRATARLASACPARWPVSRWRSSKYGSGKFTLAELIAPAIKLARDGFDLEGDTADSLPQSARPAGALAVERADFPCQRRRHRCTRATGWCSPISPHAQCHRTRRSARPSTRALSPSKIADAVRAAGGIMTADDLKNYRAVERTVVRGTYRGYDIVSMPPPSSGGVASDRDAQHSGRL